MSGLHLNQLRHSSTPHPFGDEYVSVGVETGIVRVNETPGLPLVGAGTHVLFFVQDACPPSFIITQSIDNKTIGATHLLTQGISSVTVAGSLNLEAEMGRALRAEQFDAKEVSIVHAVQRGELDGVETEEAPILGLQVPKAVEKVPSDVLQPRNTWSDKAAYDEKAKELVGMFNKAFGEFRDGVSDAVRAVEPKL